MKRNVCLTVLLTLVIAATAWGQQSSVDSRPLDATMQFLQAKLNEQGMMNWTTNYHDSADGKNWSYTFSFEVSHVVADAAACTIAYHYKIIRDGAGLSDSDALVSLHDVENVTLMTGDQRQNDNDVKAGHTTWSAKVTPPVFDLIVHAKGNAEFYFFAFDVDTASRISGAMHHAVALCGGTTP